MTALGRSALALSVFFFSACQSSELCGNAVLDMGELCDPQIAEGEPGACPDVCDDSRAATIDILTGTNESCTRVCVFIGIPACGTADGFCPPCCDAARDVDCSETCGDGVVDEGETCDGNCPTSCDDTNTCTADTLTGSADNCSAECHFDAITACTAGDSCCPDACTPANDADCSTLCGNGTIDEGETCDGDCPTSCADTNDCTTDVLTGSASTCNVVCTNTPITACTSGDSCCPTGCMRPADGDCPSLCGNGTIDEGETCDGNCPTSCADTNACTTDVMTGSASSCDVVCTNTPVTTCAADGCCPAGCDSTTDPDCALLPNGSACSAASQCAGGMCLTTFDFPGGYCTQTCGGTDGPGPCTAGGHCASLSVGPFCMADCTPGTTVCRTSYVCVNVDSDSLFECYGLSPLTAR